MRRYMAKMWDGMGWSIAGTERVAYEKIITDDLTLKVWRNPLVRNLVWVGASAFHPEEDEGPEPYRVRGWVAAVVDRYGLTPARCAWAKRKGEALVEAALLLARDYPTYDERDGYEP